MKLPTLYIVIPCYNEEDVLPITSIEFRNKLLELIDNDKIADDSKIMFVDDGSGIKHGKLFWNSHEFIRNLLE